MGRQYKIMGIVNVTRDSFYDGGRYFDCGAAVERALRLADEGADIIDIGGMSTRPGAELLSSDEEISRVVPVIRELMKRGIGSVVGEDLLTGGYGVRPVSISVDTVWSATARAAVDAGASWVNDISAGRIDPKMPEAVANAGCAVVLAHSRLMPWNMQDNPRYDDVVYEVIRELSLAVDVFKRAGVKGDRIVLDPGFGFAKNVEHNIELLRALDEIGRLWSYKLEYPVLVGLSRKSFIGAITGREAPEERLSGTLAATALAYMRGARIFRVHDVRETVDFLHVLSIMCGYNGPLKDVQDCDE